MMVKQVGDEVLEESLFEVWLELATDMERDAVIGMILKLLGVEVIRTNATKHGTTELELRRRQ